MKIIRYALLLLLCCAAIPVVHAESFLERLPLLGGAKQPKFLPVDQAFGISVTVRDGHTLLGTSR